MRVRGIRLVAVAVPIVFTTSLLAGAQMPRLPKAPKVPGTSAGQPAAPAAPAAAPRLYCGSITPNMLDRFLEALAAEKAALAQELEAARNQQHSADTDLQKVAQQQMDAMLKLSECTDAAAEKDPRHTEEIRLLNLSEAATAKGDDKLAEKYSDEASKLSSSVSAAALATCKAQKAALDNVGQGAGGALDASEAASKAMRDAEGAAAKKGAQAANLTEDEMAMLKECTIGRLQRPNITPTSPASAGAIDARRDDLQRALGLK